MNRLPFELAHQQALLPFAWLVGLHLRGHRRGAEWWWLSGVFLVSWFADTAAHLAPSARVVVSVVYPLSQAALVGLVFLSRREAMQFLLVLCAVAIIAIGWRGVSSPDVLFRTVAWGGAVGLILYRWTLGRLRVALLVMFGLCLLCWWGYVAWPSYASWGVYQAARLAGILLFCWAAMKPGPSLRLA